MSRNTKRTKIKPPEGVRTIVKDNARRRREAQVKRVELQSVQGRRNDLAPEISIVHVPTDSLRPAKRRVRKSDPVQAARIDRSIAEFGTCKPIIVDADHRIIEGHAVWEAAARAGLETVPVVVVEHLSEAQCRKLAITLNRLGETGQWDEPTLALELEELIELDEDVLVTGFELAEIDALLLDEFDEEAPEEPVPAPQRETISEPGDLWCLGRHWLLHGDALNPASYQCLMDEGGLARLVLTDEPFNVPVQGHVSGQNRHREFAVAHGEMDRDQFAAFNRCWMENALPFVMDGGLLATFIDWRSVEIVLACGRDLDLDLLNIIVWSKPNAGQGSLWRSAHELLPIFKKCSAPHINNVELGRHGRWRSNVWTYAGASSLGSEAREGLHLHPTVKPRAMLEDALLDVTERGDMVLDPFVGSGSTLLAAETTGRIGRGIEIDAGYCDVAIRRWQDLTGEDAVLDATGETFEQVAERRRAEGAQTGGDDEQRA